jgi:hypothetical protein
MTTTIDVAGELARHGAWSLFELRGEWRRLHRRAPPARMSRDLLIRGITYTLQERALGGLSKAMSRKLAQFDGAPAQGAAAKRTLPVSLKPGTRLIREWRGTTHTVLVHADGVEWRGERYASLTVVARKITGAHWSGPRFFGLRKRTGTVEGGRAQS